MRLTAAMIVLFALGAGVLLLGWLGPSEEQRFEVYCDRLWPIVVEHVGRGAKVEIHAWDEELRAPERNRGSLSSVIGNLSLDCTTGTRFR